MKKLIAIFIALEALCFYSAKAQENKINPVPDTLKIEIPENNAIIIFTANNIVKDQEELMNLPHLLKEVLVYVERGVTILDKPRIVQVKVKTGQQTKSILKDSANQASGFRRIRVEKEEMQILISENKQLSTKINIKDGELIQLLKPGWEIFIEIGGARIQVIADTWTNLKSLEEKDFQPVLNKVNSYYKFGRSPKNTKLYSRIIYKDNRIIFDERSFSERMAELVLKPNYGIGVFGDKLYPDLGITVGIIRKNKFGGEDDSFLILYNAMFVPSRNINDELKVHVNSFVSFQYGHIGVGMLLRNRGDYFRGNTIRIFLSRQIGKVKICPELFLTDNLKKPIFGLKAVF